MSGGSSIASERPSVHIPLRPTPSSEHHTSLGYKLMSSRTAIPLKSFHCSFCAFANIRLLDFLPPSHSFSAYSDYEVQTKAVRAG